MHARVSTYEFPPDRADEVIRGFDEDRSLEAIPGIVEAYMLIDRAAGRAMSVTLWETEAALQASEEEAHLIRARATGPAGGSVGRIERYEVALHERFDGARSTTA